MHIVIIDNYTGKVHLTRVFDTYKSSDKFDDFTSKTVIPNHFIVAAACKDECSEQLSFGGRKWFESMGSTEIWNVDYRQSFAFIGVYGSKSYAIEKRAQS